MRNSPAAAASSAPLRCMTCLDRDSSGRRDSPTASNPSGKTFRNPEVAAISPNAATRYLRSASVSRVLLVLPGADALALGM